MSTATPAPNNTPTPSPYPAVNTTTPSLGPDDDKIAGLSIKEWIAIGAAAGFFILLLICVCFCRKRKATKNIKRSIIRSIRRVPDIKIDEEDKGSSEDMYVSPLSAVNKSYETLQSVGSSDIGYEVPILPFSEGSLPEKLENENENIYNNVVNENLNDNEMIYNNVAKENQNDNDSIYDDVANGDKNSSHDKENLYNDIKSDNQSDKNDYINCNNITIKTNIQNDDVIYGDVIDDLVDEKIKNCGKVKNDIKQDTSIFDDIIDIENENEKNTDEYYVQANPVTPEPIRKTISYVSAKSSEHKNDYELPTFDISNYQLDNDSINSVDNDGYEVPSPSKSACYLENSDYKTPCLFPTEIDGSDVYVQFEQ